MGTNASIDPISKSSGIVLEMFIHVVEMFIDAPKALGSE